MRMEFIDNIPDIPYNKTQHKKNAGKQGIRGI